ncbi:MAG: hypothetical protein AB7F88_17555 [Pyrinomonadaceae bacterium]
MKFTNRIGIVKWPALLTAAAFCVLIVVPDTNGQGTRRKRNPAATEPAAQAPAGDAQVVSRASDFQDESIQLVPTEQKRPELPTSDGDDSAKALDEIKKRLAAIESPKKADPDEKQKRLLLNLDILNRAEQRSDSLRKQLFDMMEKETTIRAKLDMIEVNLRPEAINREVAFAGTLRPEDLREMKKKQLEVEKASLTNIMNEIQKAKAVLEQNLQRSEQLVEKLRVRIDKEIDETLAENP